MIRACQDLILYARFCLSLKFFLMTDVDIVCGYRFANLPTASLLLGLRSDTPSRIDSADVRPRVVIDTNVWLDILYWHDKSVEPLTEFLENRSIAAFTSIQCVEEFADVISRKQFHLEDRQQIDLLNRLLSLTLVCSSETAAPVKCPDPDDQKFLDLAFCVKSDFLVTKDKLVLKAGKRLRVHGTKTLTPEGVCLALDQLFVS